ncbi:hypothetical protein D9M72_576720 [compost metagenome]
MVDLFGAGGLGLHPFIDHQYTRRQRLDLLDDLAQLFAHLLHLEHAAAHLLGELVHAHHTSRYGRLDFPNHLFDVIGGHGGLVGQASHFGGDDSKTTAIFTGFSASMAALRDSRLVWSATLTMVTTT